MCLSRTTKHRLFSFLAVVSLAAGCQPDPGPADETAATLSAARANVDALDRATAEARRSRVSNPRYKLFIDIHSSDEEFGGRAAVTFDLSDVASDLTLDFAGGHVDSLRVNGVSVSSDYSGNFITLPSDALNKGQNSVDIAFRHPYSVDGTGLHRFVDPEDSNTYLYTYLWPYYANRLFPAFDQPNLKAEITMQVLAPEAWTVVSTGNGIPEPAQDGARLWTFEQTPLMSTYVFSLHAGPYAVWADSWQDAPLRLMARQSLAQYVAVDEWFEVTKKGLDHYAEYFEIPYPYGKYDQLIVPDFPIGAMENIAAVAFSERYVQRQASSRAERDGRASVILHEMAHMWFGNLVTHDWWNGLWLNESFATQMSAIAEAAVTEFDDTWHGFFALGKQDAYRRDSRVTTHPIEMPVASTADFFSVFDDITYEKGASVLKQLEHLVGPENYRRGVAAYLAEFSSGMTELDDFIRHQSQASGIDLSAWKDRWLYRAGFNVLSAEPQCEDGRLVALEINQNQTMESGPLRTHRIEIGLYELDKDGVMQAENVIDATVSDAVSRIEISEDLPCPALINPNHNDHSYAGIELRGSEIALLMEGLESIADPLGRSMFLDALFDAAGRGDITLEDFVRRALVLAATEQNPRVLQQISDLLIRSVDMMQRLRPETETAIDDVVADVERMSLTHAEFAENADIKRLWLNTFIGTATTDVGLGTASALLAGGAEIAGIEVSADIRWQLLFVLARNGAANIADLLDAEAQNDISDSGRKYHLTASAAIPTEANKLKWLDEIHSQTTIEGLAEQRAVLYGLFPAVQTDLQLTTLPALLESLTVATTDADPYFISSYVSSLLTPMCRQESYNRLSVFINEHAGDLNTTASRFLLEARQADGECLAIRDRQ